MDFNANCTTPIYDVTSVPNLNMSETSRNETNGPLLTIAYYLGLFYPWIYSTIGIPLNFLTIVQNCKRWMLTSHCIYVTLLSLVDSIAMVHKLVSKQLPVFSIAFTPEVCKYLQYTIEVSSQLSSWILVLLTFERAVVVKFPFSRLKRDGAKHALFAVCIVSVVLASVNFHQFFTVTSLTGKSCNYEPKFYEDIKSYWYITDLALYAILPIFIIIGSTLAIVNGLRKRMRNTNRQAMESYSALQSLRACKTYSNSDSSENETLNANVDQIQNKESNDAFACDCDNNTVTKSKSNKVMTKTSKIVHQNEESMDIVKDQSYIKTSGQNKHQSMNSYKRDDGVRKFIGLEQSLPNNCVLTRTATSWRSPEIETGDYGKFSGISKKECKDDTTKEEALTKDVQIKTHYSSVDVEIMKVNDSCPSSACDDSPKTHDVDDFIFGITHHAPLSPNEADKEKIIKMTEEKCFAHKGQIETDSKKFTIANTLFKGRLAFAKQRKHTKTCVTQHNKHTITTEALTAHRKPTHHCDHFVPKGKKSHIFYKSKKIRRAANFNLESQISKTTKSVLVGSLTFVTLTISYCCCGLYASIVNSGQIPSKDFQFICTIAIALRDLNHVVNYFIYTKRRQKTLWRKSISSIITQTCKSCHSIL